MRRFLPFAAIALLLAAPAAAQFADEATFNTSQAKKLNGYASKAFKRGFPRKAKIVWLMVLSEYDPDNEEAHEALGHAKVGDSWGPRSDFSYPTEDDPNPSAAKALRSEWESLAKALGSAHRRLAQDYEKAGRTDRARYHFEKVIRYVPDDKSAKEALEHKPVEGLSGTDLERVLYDRSKKIEVAVNEQFKIDYQVEDLPDSDQSPVLARAGVAHRSVKSEHFTLRGELEPDLMKQAAINAERAIRVVGVAFEGYDGFYQPGQPFPQLEVLFVAKKETFQQVLDANADAFMGDQEDFNFTRAESASATLRTSDGFVAVYSVNSENTMYDSAVRRVAEIAAGFKTTALDEGIGHTFVGMFFNNNRLFSIDRQRQIKTSTEDEIAYNSPNFDEWKDLALEGAWKKTGVPAAELPLFTAAQFPNEARIKAWSFCDYVVRRDPSLLRSLDSLNKRDANLHNPIDIAEAFAKKNDGLTLAQLEKEWRDFWTEASPVLKAIRNNTPPLDAVSKDVEKWLEAFNEERKKHGAPAVSWSAAYSSRCAEHAEYLKANKKLRGPEHEQSQDTDLEGATHLGNMFAQMALVSTNAKKPDDLFEEWLNWPGYRDALINLYLWTVGIYAERGILVMDVIRGVRGESKKEGAGYTFYPRNIRAVPTEVNVEDLGPELAKLLADNGHADKQVVGFPVSFHGFGASLPGDRNSFRCQLSLDGQVVEGLTHIGASGGSNRRTSAPGMVVFYPLEPLKRGATYGVSWSFTRQGELQRVTGQFTTR